MKKGIVMSIVAVIAAAAGVVITVLALVKRGQKHLKDDYDYDDIDYLDEDFSTDDDFDEADSPDVNAAAEEQLITENTFSDEDEKTQSTQEKK